ncbi:SDR family oxidoreductase [Streptomyces sp. NBC_01006]|uniref:SDR family oxidoreductase n=1 Tax=Streptomyces sp. NBC_01006 TaxID=2903716 RepID=UPI003863448A|nr:SDR family oxidoreductase [Streptomyces sp. NBC_01006]
MSTTLSGRRVVILGGTSGIGLATASLAARQGAQVVTVSSGTDSAARALAALPAGTSAEVADLRDPAQIAAVFERVGAFDHLVFTAGEPLALMRLDELDIDAAREFFALRYFGALGAVAAAAPLLRPGGSVVLTSGTASSRPGPGWAVAASICGAVEALVRALAVELAPIRVNAVSAGVVRSPLWSRIEPAERERMYEQTGASLPLGRVGEVAEVAEAYVYLLRQSYATGTVLSVDGGTALA